jgi:hypothetical protein
VPVELYFEVILMNCMRQNTNSFRDALKNFILAARKSFDKIRYESATE